MNARPVRQENTIPIVVGQHYGFSDFSEFRSMQPDMPRSLLALIGCLSGEHMNCVMELMIRRRPSHANGDMWPITSTISVFQRTTNFILHNDPSIWNIGVLAIHVAGNHWATGVIDLADSHFYVFDSMFSEENKDEEVTVPIDLSEFTFNSPRHSENKTDDCKTVPSFPFEDEVVNKFKLEANAVINLSFKLSSFDFAVDITDDAEIVAIAIGIMQGETGPMLVMVDDVLKECIGDILFAIHI
ncbi:phospholipase-like protein [Tanacetum coccineum]|uniref:Phospholipase-like protein n=1 Tax=Tanacetum coccineum TaxID=301880 RepID=A0ABQ5GSQ9_9ASTR